MTTARPGVRLDERTAALIMMKCLPLSQLIQALYPDMYKVPPPLATPHCCAALLFLTHKSTGPNKNSYCQSLGSHLGNFLKAPELDTKYDQLSSSYKKKQ